LPIQTKLAVSQPGDQFEQEADRVAEQVMRMAEPSQMATPPALQPMLAQRKAQDDSAEPSGTPSRLVDETLNSAGQPLDPVTRAFMEERFDHDFGGVRVHSDAQAADSARAVNALAYTVNRNVVFGSGQFKPAANDGRRLLAHELAHTIQQGGRIERASAGFGVPARREMASPPGDRSSSNAGEPRLDGLAAGIAKTAASVSLQRQPAPACEGNKPLDPDALGPAFVKQKSDVEKLGPTKNTVKARIEGMPYVLFSPHCAAGEAPLKGLVEGGDAYLIRSGQIYKQVWAQQQGKSADTFYWGWINPSLIKAAPTETTQTEPPKKDQPKTEPTKDEQALPPLTAKPAVDCPADLGSSAAMKCFVESVREEIRHSSEGDIYQAQLKHAVKLLEKAGFGRLEGAPVQYDPTAPPEWEGETYNKDFWKEEEHPKFLRKLVLKPDKQPSDAIDDMFSNLGKWNVDCGQFVQVAHLYALRHALGTRGFNQMNKSDVSFELKPQASTALHRVKFYERFKPDAQMLRYPEKELETKSADELLKEAPVGSRIMWTNLEAGVGTAYRNENTLKLGDDQFAAHGFLAELKKNIFTRKELELALARITNKSADEAYIKANVFIAEIEHYQMPKNPEP